MKTAIIYYSFEGNCALVAGALKELLEASPFKGKADLFEITLMDTKKRTGFAKYLWGGRQVLFHKKPAIQPLTVDPAAYDLLILGTPVWAASPSPALVSFLDTVTISGKKLALFCCHAGGKGRTLDKFKALLPGNEFVGGMDFIEPRKNPGALKEKVGDWIKGFVQ